jgi:hypothetical protein
MFREAKCVPAEVVTKTSDKISFIVLALPRPVKNLFTATSLGPQSVKSFDVTVKSAPVLLYTVT